MPYSYDSFDLDEEDVENLDEICGEFQNMDRDMALLVIARGIYELGFDLHQIKEAIEQLDS